MTVRRAVLAVGVAALGVASADAALRAPEFSLAGDSAARVAVGVAAGWAVAGAGFLLGLDRWPATGRLLVACGCAWLAAGLASPGARLAPLFTAGLVFAAAAPAPLAHALLGSLRDRPPAWPARLTLGLLYASLVGLLGVGQVLLFDPARAGCAACPANLLAIADAPDAAATVARWGTGLGLLATASAIALALLGLARAGAARRRRAAALVVFGCAYLALAAGDLGHAWSRGALGNDDVDQALWTGQALALLGLAGALALLRLADGRRRARLARAVVELADARRAGGLRDVLARHLGDPDLDLLHADAAAGGWIDAGGHPRTPPPGLAHTRLVRDGRAVGLLCHRPGLMDDPRVAPEIERSVRLGLEHERLQAALRRQLEHLRRSRADVVAAGEAERRLLERDLHDGAQQRLAALTFELGIARRRAGPEHAAPLEHAQREVHDALGELRDIAHGLYPVALADAGLAAAIESLGDRRPGLHATAVPAGRLAPAVEETAYFAIAGLAADCAPHPLTVTAERHGGQLVIALDTPMRVTADLVDIEDRVGALGGTVTIDDRPSERTRVTIQLPCA